MASTNIRAVTGNRVLVSYDGKTIGMVQGLTINVGFNLEPLYGIGDIDPGENVPTQASYGASSNFVKLFRGDMTAAGISAINGADALLGVIFDICVFSKDTGALMKKLVGCSYDSGTVNITKNAVIIQDAQFKALNCVGDGL